MSRSANCDSVDEPRAAPPNTAQGGPMTETIDGFPLSNLSSHFSACSGGIINKAHASNNPSKHARMASSNSSLTAVKTDAMDRQSMRTTVPWVGIICVSSKLARLNIKAGAVTKEQAAIEMCISETFNFIFMMPETLPRQEAPGSSHAYVVRRARSLAPRKPLRPCWLRAVRACACVSRRRKRRVDDNSD